MSTVGTLALPDTDLAHAAVAFSEARVPDFVHFHCIRSYVYGRELARQDGLVPGRDYDDELLFLCNVLHDLGLSTNGQGDERFEVDGADKAVAFARGAGLAESKIPTLWDAVALHTAIGIANRKQAEIAITALGVGVDITGGEGRAKLPSKLVNEVDALYPRLDVGYALAEAIATGVRKKPSKAAPFTFANHLAEVWASATRDVSYFDFLQGAGWGDRPVGGFATVGTSRPEGLADAFTERLAKGDVDGLLALYDANALFSPQPGVTAQGHDQIRPALAAMVEAGTRLSLAPVSIRVVEDEALIENTAQVFQPDSEQPNIVRTSEVARRRGDGRWVYLIDTAAAN